jgi:tetratricopeptide (TPR) repeat protein
MIDSDALRGEALGLLDLFQVEDAPNSDFWEKRLPTEVDRQRSLAEALDRIGVEAFNDGNTKAARNAFFLLFLLRLALVKREPDSRGALRDFASSEDLLGLATLEMGNLVPAEELLSEALTYRRGLYQDEPTDAHAAYLYGVALWHMARLERAKSSSTRELEWAQQADEHLAKVDASWPGVPFIVHQLAEVRQRLAEPM